LNTAFIGKDIISCDQKYVVVKNQVYKLKSLLDPEGAYMLG
jgi:hypothetical protein